MVQIVEQTHDEKVEMYKKCTKLELIEMLISCNLHLEAVIKQLHKHAVVGRSEQLVCDCKNCKPFPNHAAGFRKNKNCIKDKAN
jgi:hypothetical protein